MKKKIKILLAFALIMQCFSFINSVLAAEETLEFKIISVKDGYSQVELELEDGKYVIDKYKNITIRYELENANQNKQYLIFKTINGNTSFEGYYYGETEITIPPHYEEYSLKVCDNFNCQTEYDKIDIRFDNKLYELNNEIDLVIEEVKQGNKVVTANGSNKYQLNNYEDIEISLKSKNLETSGIYCVDVNDDYNGQCYFQKTGNELNNGITLKVNPLVFSRLKVYREELDLDELIEIPVDRFLDITNEVENFEVTLKYTNYKDINIFKPLDVYETEVDWYVIYDKYHDKNRSLTLNFKGNEISEDIKYKINIEILKNKQEVYKIVRTINGTDLKNGYDLELKDLVLEYIKNIDEPSYVYDIYIYGEHINNYLKMKYNSEFAENASLDSYTIYPNGEINLLTRSGAGNGMKRMRDFPTHVSAFENGKKVYIHYWGKNLIDDQEYSYELQYFDDSGHALTNMNDISIDVLKSGNIIGNILNRYGLILPVDNLKNYKRPKYRLVLKKGEEVIGASGVSVRLTENPIISNVRLSAKNRFLYSYVDNVFDDGDISYIATRNAPIEITVSGFGFDETKTHPFVICYYKNGDYSDSECEKINIQGRDLNNSNSVYFFNENIDESIERIIIYAGGDDDYYFTNDVPYPGEGYFTIKFVDSKDFFGNISRYLVDNTLDVIKNIKKQTDINTFKDSIELKNNNTIDIYDREGNIVSDNIGTGMRATIKDEKNRNMLDMDIVVTGDVSGDGDITITDLIKVRHHLAEMDELTGVYEIAGNVTDNGEISITDLIRIRHDIAEMDELN